MLDLNQNKPAPGFDSPLDMLHACHDRIMDQCATLQKLQQHLPMHGCDTQAQQAAQTILRYFDTAGRFHHQDEEEDLFPRLRDSGNSDAAALMQQLLQDHQNMDALWAKLRALLLEVAAGELAELERKLVADFTLAYGKHVMLENLKLLPLSARLLSSAQLQQIGSNMAARRGVTIP